jgi:hypothetical protein
MKAAILILVHKNKPQIERLIKHLSVDFDIYVHIDKQSDFVLQEDEHIFIYKEYNTYWASFNLVAATLLLLREASRKQYERYILISGQDLPIKSNKEIYAFFENNNNENIRNESFPNPSWKRTGGGFLHVNKFWPVRKKRDRKGLLDMALYKCERFFCELIFLVWKRPLNYNFYSGSQWFNITHKCVRGIFEYLEADKRYIKRFRWTNSSDEIFFHTLVNLIDGVNIVNSDLRYIDWSGPERPRILRLRDYEKIENSTALFARKFDENVDSEIIDILYKKWNK